MTALRTAGGRLALGLSASFAIASVAALVVPHTAGVVLLH